MAAAKRGTGSTAPKPRRKRQRKTRTLAVSSDDDSDSSSSSSSSSSDDSDSEVPVKSTAVRQRSASMSSSSSSSSSSTSSSSASSSSSSSSSSADSDNSSSDSENPPKHRRGSVKRSKVNIDESNGAAPSSSSGKRKHVFRLTPEPEERPLKLGTSKKQTSYETISLKALQPPAAKLPAHLQRIVDSKASSASAKRSGTSRSRSTPQQSQAQRERRQQAFRSLWLKAVADEFGDELDTIRTREPTLGADGGTRLPLFIDALASGSELFSTGKTEQHSTSSSATAEIGKSGQDAVDEVALASNLR